MSCNRLCVTSLTKLAPDSDCNTAHPANLRGGLPWRSSPVQPCPPARPDAKHRSGASMSMRPFVPEQIQLGTCRPFLCAPVLPRRVHVTPTGPQTRPANKRAMRRRALQPEPRACRHQTTQRVASSTLVVCDRLHDQSLCTTGGTQPTTWNGPARRSIQDPPMGHGSRFLQRLHLRPLDLPGPILSAGGHPTHRTAVRHHPHLDQQRYGRCLPDIGRSVDRGDGSATAATPAYILVASGYANRRSCT